MSDNGLFWENIWERYGKQYEEWCEANELHPDTSDFSLWLEEQHLIPEYDYDD